MVWVETGLHLRTACPSEEEGGGGAACPSEVDGGGGTACPSEVDGGGGAACPSEVEGGERVCHSSAYIMYTT